MLTVLSSFDKICHGLLGPHRGLGREGSVNPLRRVGKSVRSLGNLVVHILG